MASMVSRTEVMFVRLISQNGTDTYEIYRLPDAAVQALEPHLPKDLELDWVLWSRQVSETTVRAPEGP